LVDSVESMMMHGQANPKFGRKKLIFNKWENNNTEVTTVSAHCCSGQ
jgi:hypothetical protein